MKKVTLLLVLSMFIFSANAQNRSIQFKHSDWKQAVKQAKKEKKLIFIDFHTTWCGPCKRLSKEIFTLDNVADFYNQNFICMKLDAEKDADGVVLSKKHKINCYPTMLFIDPKTEEVVHRVAGAGEAEEIIKNGKTALDPEKSFGALETRYKNGDRNGAFIAQYLNVLSGANCKEQQTAVFDSFIESLTPEDFGKQENWEMFKNNVSDVLSPAFDKFFDNRESIYKSIDPKDAYKEFVKKVNYSVHDVCSGMKGAFMNEKGIPELEQLIELCQKIDDPSMTMKIVMLKNKIASVKKDYQAIYDIFVNVYSYNMFIGNSDYSYLFGIGNSIAKLDDKEKLNKALTILDNILAYKEIPADARDEYYRVIHLQRESILRKLGDTVKADEARKLHDDHFAEVKRQRESK